jgi:hypothetical protein
MDLFDILTWAEILVKTTFLGTPTLTVLSSRIATTGQLRSSFRHDHFLGLLYRISMNVFEFGAPGTEGSMLETLSMECYKVSIILNLNATRRAFACMRLCHFFFLHLKVA